MTNVFAPIGTQAPPPFVGARDDHPAPRLGINQSTPIPTNKFYANFFLGAQNQGTWTHPYSVSWSKGSGNAGSWGMSIAHIEDSQKAFGPGDPARYYINPIGIQSMILSAAELGNQTVVTSDNLRAFSANVHLHPRAGSPPGITFPLVQGMGFVTGIYNGLRPVVNSSVFFRSVNRATDFTRPGMAKYRIVLEDGRNWLMYVTSTDGGNLTFNVPSNSRMEAEAPLRGFIQIAKNPGAGQEEAVYDASAGVYPRGVSFSGFVNGTLGSYTFRFRKGGVDTANRRLVMFALPHHVESFDGDTRNFKTSIRLQTTTKGLATAVHRDSWTFIEQGLPTTMGFGPWDRNTQRPAGISQSAIQTISQVAAGEINQDINGQTNLDSMYFSGKALAKFATLVYTVNDLLRDSNLARSGLERLKAAFAVFAENRQKFPLVYERAWKGVVSTASYVTGDAGVDFGNTYYNDHHFHYGYHIYTAAVIGYLDPSWLQANRDWVNMLLRDAANSVDSDPYFPFSRGFDWYHGHSWAKGVFESADGKDEESSSEDGFFAFAVKMWGRTLGDASIEGRGNLMLAVLARTFHNYFLMEDSNPNQPRRFIGNKVTGILFENKVDYATYFGLKTEYIHGIHMIPINPSTPYTRNPTFVRQEWERFFGNGRAEQQAEGGWRGILMANLALVDPRASWRFFSQANFSGDWIDSGASRTWYLAFAAALGGADGAAQREM